MEPRYFFTIFGAVFLAEIADKTQLATLLFATDARYSKWLVFAASDWRWSWHRASPFLRAAC